MMHYARVSVGAVVDRYLRIAAFRRSRSMSDAPRLTHRHGGVIALSSPRQEPVKMSRAKKSANRTRSKATGLGVAGMTLSLLTGASAALAHPSLNESPDSRTRAVVLSEEEISDVSLATFYAVDRESQSRAPRRRLAIGACGGGCACGFGCAGACWSGTYYSSQVFGETPPPREPIRPVQKYRHIHKQTNNRENR
jgi:hypothetical protein